MKKSIGCPAFGQRNEKSGKGWKAVQKCRSRQARKSQKPHRQVRALIGGERGIGKRAQGGPCLLFWCPLGAIAVKISADSPGDN